MPGQHRRARHTTHHTDRPFRPAHSRRRPRWRLPLGLAVGLAGALAVGVSYVNAHPTRPSVGADRLRTGEVARWDGSAQPSDPVDSNPAPSVELGTRFTASTPGTVTAILFHQHPENTGAHTGTPWNGPGTVPKPFPLAPTAAPPEHTPPTTSPPTVPPTRAPTATRAPAPAGCRPDGADTGWQHTGVTSSPQPCHDGDNDGGILQILTPGTPIDGGDGRCGVNIVIPLPGHHRCGAGGR
jgi:hypothetical protein